MHTTKTKIIVICGQTATGKSDFAVQIAKHIGGEIISADSRQVYKGMDLGTGKITKKEMKGIPHYVLDVVSPKKIFTVTDFKNHAEKAIKKIYKNNHIPIICGGTGFYIDALLSRQVLPEVKANPKLRKELEKKSKEELFKMLKKLDSVRAENIDKDNPVRLIRAIEIATTLGKVPPLTELGVGHLIPYEMLYIGLVLPDETLKENIHSRLLSRIKKGMIHEVKKLHEEEVSWKRLENFGLEYRYCARYLKNKITKPELIEKLKTEIWHYAKRQKTWFKRNQKILWINPEELSDQAKALHAIKLFLQHK